VSQTFIEKWVEKLSPEDKANFEECCKQSLYDSMNCTCSLEEKTTKDGCSICNPDFWENELSFMDENTK
jgi:hypothetical protein